MLITRVIPCLLLKGRGLVKTVRFKDPTYVGDPINAIKIFNEKEVDELIFLDITATLEKRPPPYQVISEIASECFMPLAYGGGIRSLPEIEKIFSLGVEKVCLNAAAVEDPDLIRDAAKAFGNQSIVVSVDVKKSLFGKYEIFTHGGRRSARKEILSHVRRMEELGAGELLLTSIDRDGTRQGYDLDLIGRVADAVGIPVIACGGAGGLNDITAAVKSGAAAAAAGSLFVFHGRHRAVLISYPSREELDAAFPAAPDRET
ncbi:MAG: imidazole glycerol phosphate synthase subunit HisF [Deltaproteobacteria bacterium HGW-Deltaproteobacteria-19]|jgi:cyclase|nr:MAG: imidazole glycerol phosphate synthase subunit HisF [Deltaproteobacteria bacterium HGW-Deltaproteobacteria-19]